MSRPVSRSTGRLAVPLVGLVPGLRRAHPFELLVEVDPGATHYRLILADSVGRRAALVSETPSFELGPDMEHAGSRVRPLQHAELRRDRPGQEERARRQLSEGPHHP